MGGWGQGGGWAGSALTPTQGLSRGQGLCRLLGTLQGCARSSGAGRKGRTQRGRAPRWPQAGQERVGQKMTWLWQGRGGWRRSEARPVGVAIRSFSSQEDGVAAGPGWRDRTRLVPDPGSSVFFHGDPGHWPASYTGVTLEPRLWARKHSPSTPGPSDLGFLQHNAAKHGLLLMWVCEASRRRSFLTGAIHGPDKACTLQWRHLGPAGIPPPCFFQYLIS